MESLLTTTLIPPATREEAYARLTELLKDVDKNTEEAKALCLQWNLYYEWPDERDGYYITHKIFNKHGLDEWESSVSEWDDSGC